MKIRVAHSPDSDDAFMFYALAEGLVDTDGIEYVHELQDIESLNQRVLRGELDVSAVSFHAFAFVADRYALLPCGASMGDGYGPRLVAKRPASPADVHGARVAVPGLLTSAHLALRLLVPAFEPVVTPFDRIEAAVQSGDIEFGLLIHEGQLTFANSGLHLVADLGRWWQERTGLPLPLGGNAVRKDLGSDVSRLISGHLRASIDYALGHRADALAFSSRFARGLNLAQTDTFVGMYVNQWTLDLGEKGRRAVREFLAQGAEAGLVPSGVAVEFVAD